MSRRDLVTLAVCDLAAITRGRSVFADELDEYLLRGVGWVPANHALTPMGPVAEGDPFGAIGDLRLLPDPVTRARVAPGEGGASALELLLCDIVETDGSPWSACPRQLLRDTVAELASEAGAVVWASFEHEFQLDDAGPAAPPFSIDAQRRVDPLGVDVMGALAEAGLEPERFFAEYAPHQFEIPLAAAPALPAADRAVLFREIVREIVRRCGWRATFSPLLDPEAAGNGVHIHLALRADNGSPLLYDPKRDGCLSELGGSFAAGVLAHAPALCALTAPSPVSMGRLGPHHWSAGAVCVGERNREALLRLPPRVTLGGGEEAPQMRFEYRAADASANPHVALAAILRAGLHGIREAMPAPPILETDPSGLEGDDARRFGVGGLPSTLVEALEALAQDGELRGWLPPLLYDAHVSIKRAELDAGARLDLPELCRRYAAFY